LGEILSRWRKAGRPISFFTSANVIPLFC
jgi:hypothetical protein